MDISLTSFIASIPIFIVAMVIHEVAHGWVANKLGDPTARTLGRLTLNPMVHIDPFGTVILPILLIVTHSPVIFGWAKPVPINFFGLSNPKRDIIWVGLAGPLANIVFAFMLFILFSVLFHLLPVIWIPLTGSIISYSILVNLVLAAFNLIPIPPLDGSRILFGLLPTRLAVKYMRIERYGILILFLLLWFGLIDWFVIPIISALAKIIGL